MKEPVDHVLRPKLPWRSDEGAITECGYDASKVKTLTREEFAERFRDMGQQRMAILTCMTCVDTARRWHAWDTDPRQALQREIEWEHRGRWSREDGRRRLTYELRAIAALIDAHREEFEQEVAKLQGVAEWQATKKETQDKRAPRKARGRW